MKIQIICGFKQTNLSFLNLEAEYLKRLKRHFKIEVVEVPLKSKEDPEECKKFQSEILFAKVPANSYLIILDEKGEQLTSKNFSQELQKVLNIGGLQNLVFLIGGPMGLADEIRNKGNKLLSLSKMTYTADFARTLLIEQIYRAYSILNNLPYHKE